MTQEEYMTIQSQLLIIGELLVCMDLPEFLRRIEHADSVGPILDPTLYGKAGATMHEVKRLAQAAMCLRSVRMEQLARGGGSCG